MNWLAGLLSIGINIDYDSGNRSASGSGSDHGVDERNAAEARAKAIWGYRSSANAGAKYKPNAADKELIGIQDAVLFWASGSGVDNSTDDDGNSGLHLSIFDTSTRADSAQVELLNDSGDTQYVVAAAIKAKPIVRLSGEQGFTHDAFVDYQDIFLSGENQFEFGNNFVVTKAQLEQLADFYAKSLGVIVGDSSAIRAKHIYSVTIPGRCWWFEPGEWYTLQIGGAGQREYIDAVCECYSVQVEASADGLGATRVDFREVEQNWVKDSNAVARFLATGDPRWKPNNFGRVVVAAKDYLGTADYYCDGTADQTEIQAAIDYLANAFGGGLVELTEGQFNITGYIDLSYDNMILRGHGNKTVIEKNADANAIYMVGIESNKISSCRIADLRITRNAGDSNGNQLVYIQYADNLFIDSVEIYNSADVGIDAGYLSNSIIYNCSVLSCVGNGIAYVASTNSSLINCHVRDCHAIGILFSADGSNSRIADCISEYNYFEGIYVIGNNISIENNISRFSGKRGIIIQAGDSQKGNNIVKGNIVQENGDTTNVAYSSALGDSSGIYVDSLFLEGNIVTANYSKENGNILDEPDCESLTPPAITGENSDTLTQCTYARSDVQEYKGTYSYLLTKIVAAGTASTAYLTDSAATNDLHGLYAGQEYRFGAWVYIPAGGMTGAELTLVIRDYVAAWEEESQACALTYDAWQYVEVTKTLRAGSIGATFGFAIASTAANAETAYTDNLRLTPMGTGNLHNQNFYDAGTNTYTGV